METGLRGKTALITGGATGLGLAIAKALASEGVDLAIASRDPEPAGIEELRRTGVKVTPIAADVSREDEVVGMVRKSIDAMGRLDLYVNNAAWTWHQPVTRIDTQSWTSTINTNLSACVWACREAARHMIGRGEGSILIVGSTATYTPQYRELSYRVSKTGLITAMEILAIELAPYRIRVNMIIPGHFVTKLTAGFNGEPLERLKRQVPLRRSGDTDEVGPAAVLLLSDKLSGYTTGAKLLIDGGLHLHPLPILSDDEIRALNAPPFPES